MTDVKRLLEQATPLPWDRDATQEDEPVVFVHKETPDGISYASVLFEADWGTDADAALIVHAVNHLADYEAAVDALERLVHATAAGEAHQRTPSAVINARAALARLRGEVPV